MNQDLQLFVREALAEGLSRKDIATELQKAGWQADEITGALGGFADSSFAIPVPRRRPYTSAREAFMYLLMFLTLYISAYSFGTILFQFINRWLPDAAQIGYGYAYDATAGALRMGTASLVVAFPVFMLMSYLITKAIRRDPEKGSSKVRKWLTYLTLFVAAGVIIGDLISLIYSLLQGELTLRFILKVLTIGSIAGSIFGWYLWDLRGTEEETKPKSYDHKR